MGRSDAREEYWFDAAPLSGSRSGVNPLTRLGSLLPGRQLRDEQHEALVDFAEANGLLYSSRSEVRNRIVPMPSLVLDGTCEAIVMDGDPDADPASGAPHVEIGNHGWRFWKADDDGSPSRRGYIAIRHGLDLPRMYLAARGPGAATVLAAASTVVNVAGSFDPERSEPTITPVDGFRKRATRLELPESLGFTAYVEANRLMTSRAKADLKAEFGHKARAEAKRRAKLEPELDAARAARAEGLVRGPAAPLLSELATSFDIEVEGDWIYAYSSFGELSTLDPEIWAWAFGSASRLIDVLEAWGLDASGTRNHPWYTPESIERPRKIDGELRALVPKQGGAVRKFLFGGEPG